MSFALASSLARAKQALVFCFAKRVACSCTTLYLDVKPFDGMTAIHMPAPSTIASMNWPYVARAFSTFFSASSRSSCGNSKGWFTDMFSSWPLDASGSRGHHMVGAAYDVGVTTAYLIGSVA